jgi:hypothetical protein
VRRGVVMVKQPGLLSPKFGATSSHVYTQPLPNVAAEAGVHSLACWNKFFVLPPLLYRWRHKSGVLWILRSVCIYIYMCVCVCAVVYPVVFSRGFQQIQLRTEGSENGDLGAVAPYSGVPLNLQMSETLIPIRLLRMYFPWNWEFGSALSTLRNFGGWGLNPPNPPSLRHW